MTYIFAEKKIYLNMAMAAKNIFTVKYLYKKKHIIQSGRGISLLYNMYT